jgi:hypothetical protein
LGNKKNSKATIDQKKEKKRNCEREKEQSLKKGKKKMGNLVASFAYSGGVVYCAPPLKWL